MESTRYEQPVINALLKNKARRVTKYFSPTYVVSATVRSFQGKVDWNSKSLEILLKIGKPNYAEREFIKKCKKAGEPFPVKKLQFKFFKD